MKHLRSIVWLSVLVLGACDDHLFVHHPGGGQVEGDGFCAVQSIFAGQCLGCHSAGGAAGGLSLEGDLEATLLADGQYGVPLVIPGDPAGSLLLLKVRGEQQADQGSAMPPGSTGIDAAQADLIEAWIADGAPFACDEVPPTGIEPGGPITVGAPPEDYGTTKPAFAPEGTCATEQWWQHPGDEEDGATMHPGQACISCHAAYGDGPLFSWAGTVMGGLTDGDECRGVPGVTVELLDQADQVIATERTNAAGNFMIRRSVLAFEAFRVRLTYDGRTREMYGHTSQTGDCNSCHTAEGANGAPGRIVAP